MEHRARTAIGDGAKLVPPAPREVNRVSAPALMHGHSGIRITGRDALQQRAKQHALDDKIVVIENSRIFAAAMKAAKRPVEPFSVWRGSVAGDGD